MLTRTHVQLSLVFSIKSLAPHAHMNMELSGINTPTIDPIIIIEVCRSLSPALTPCYYISTVF